MPMTIAQISQIYDMVVDSNSLSIPEYGSAVQFQGHSQAAKRTRFFDDPTVRAWQAGHADLDYDSVGPTGASSPADRALAMFVVGAYDEIQHITANRGPGGTRAADGPLLDAAVRAGQLDSDEFNNWILACPAAVTQQARLDMLALGVGGVAALPALVGGGVGREAVSLDSVNVLMNNNVHTTPQAAPVPPAAAVAQAAAPPIPPAAGPALAVPAGYNQGMNEAQVLAAGAALPLQHNLHVLVNAGRPHQRLDSAGIGIAGPYQSTMAFPQVPVVHPYHPSGNTPANARVDQGIACFSLSTRLPSGTLSNLPPGAAEYLVQNNINLQNVEVFVSFQNRPWQNDALEFRPHPWLHQDAPERGVYNGASNLRVAFADLNSRFSVPVDARAVTHGEGAEVVFSPNNMQIVGLGDHNTSEAFYSLCINRDTGRVAITFHCLLNDAHQALLERIVPQLVGAGGGAVPSLQNVYLTMVAGGLPQQITDGLAEFMNGRAVAAIVQPVSQYSIAQAQMNVASNIAAEEPVRRRIEEARALQIQVEGAASTPPYDDVMRDPHRIAFWTNENGVENYLQTLRQRAAIASNAASAHVMNDSVRRRVEEARALQIQVEGAASTPPYDDVMRDPHRIAFWTNQQGSELYLQGLRQRAGAASNAAAPRAPAPNTAPVSSGTSMTAGYAIHSTEASVRRRIEEARALQIEIEGAASTPPYDEVMRDPARRAYWTNEGLTQNYLQDLRQQAEVRRRIEEARALQVQIDGVASTPPYDEVMRDPARRAYWTNDRFSQECLQTLRAQLRQRNQMGNA